MSTETCALCGRPCATWVCNTPLCQHCYNYEVIVTLYDNRQRSAETNQILTEELLKTGMYVGVEIQNGFILTMLPARS